MKCRLLTSNDFEDLYKTFYAAFSSENIKLQPTRDEFEYRIYNKLHVDNDISAVAFDGDNMIGFILHAANIFQGIPTAYNGGTGVLPGFRNQKTAEELYAYLIPKIQSKFLARILLEVVENNEHAIKLYEKIGFNFKRRFLCFKQVTRMKGTPAHEVVEGTISDVDFDFMDFESSFLDSGEHLNLGTEKVLVAQVSEEVVGYLIFQPHIGRISQLAVSRNYRRMGVAESLILAAQEKTSKALTIMNIPEDEVGFEAFLKQHGFENQVNQFEMELII
ncbi:MAG: hypothetical protein Tsb0034_18180 [Ekhidna sp.]